MTELISQLAQLAGITIKERTMSDFGNKPGQLVVPRNLATIAREIRSTWPNVNYAAKPYLQAMFDLRSVTDRYGQDSAGDIVRYFLANASSWRGPDARRIKAELKGML
jgi:hypothetical protein